MNKPDILLIEDNPGDVLLIEKALAEGDPVQVNVVRTGAEAVKYLRKEGEFAGVGSPDIIILDLNIPSLDGRELLKMVKADPKLLRIPVIVLTSSKAENDLNGSYDARANAYIIKPSGWEEFRHVVQETKRFWLKTASLPRKR
jgi:two-component system, chemotaxis family, response regulator Rcp1